MSFNILPCISYKTTRDLSRGACIPVKYHVKMCHADMGVTSKGFHTSPPGSSCCPVLGVFETGCNSQQFFQVGSPQSHCSAPHS